MQFDEDLQCPVCLEHLTDPMMHSKCRCMYCADCVSGCRQICPLCRYQTNGIWHSVPRYVTNKLDALKVKCMRCSSVMTRGQFNEHDLNCPFACPKCGEMITKKDVGHKGICMWISAKRFVYDCFDQLSQYGMK